jgi:DNA modification methylase
MEITRTELVWPGKYDEHGDRVAPPRVNLPFQIIETINESRATREARKMPAQTSLFDFWGGDEGQTFEDGWRNKLIWGDNVLVMSSLLENYAGKIDLIYIDPPFATGVDFAVSALVGDADDQEMTKAQSAIEEKAYRDTWGRGLESYLAMMRPRLELMRDLLSDRGTLWVHLDWHVGHYVKLLLDEVFGQASFLNEVVRVYAGGGQSKNFFPRKHDPLFVYTKGNSWIFNEDEVRVPYDSEYKSTVFAAKDSRAPGKTYRPNEKGKIPEDWWLFNRPYGDEIVGYPTQKPEALIERIVNVSSSPGSIVADFFVGSGTTPAVAERLGRRWIAVDLGRFAVHTTRKRLMGMEGCQPFEVLNLGKYERQYWQTSAFHGRDPEQVLFEYLAFILKLYGAVPVAGLQHIHGKKGGAVIHVGAVDAPVTIDEVMEALDECVATGQKELHVLGWEWEMGLNDTVDQLAVERGVRMRLLAIPREVMETQAVDRGDIRFFELAHLDCSIDLRPKRHVVVGLTSFALSEADGIDPEVLARIEKWSDFVDYWAVDWDFKNDTFVNGWVAYRTRKERRLSLSSDAHAYEATGTYRIAVKVVDIFGNDTTKVFPVEVR